MAAPNISATNLCTSGIYCQLLTYLMDSLKKYITQHFPTTTFRHETNKIKNFYSVDDMRNVDYQCSCIKYLLISYLFCFRSLIPMQFKILRIWLQMAKIYDIQGSFFIVAHSIQGLIIILQYPLKNSECLRAQAHLGATSLLKIKTFIVFLQFNKYLSSTQSFTE